MMRALTLAAIVATTIAGSALAQNTPARPPVR